MIYADASVREHPELRLMEKSYMDALLVAEHDDEVRRLLRKRSHCLDQQLIEPLVDLVVPQLQPRQVHAEE